MNIPHVKAQIEFEHQGINFQILDTNPYGFNYITIDGEQVDDSAYTSFEEAIKAIQSKDWAIKEVTKKQK